MNPWIPAAVLAVLIGMRFLRTHILAWLGAWWVGIFAILKFGISPPLPASIIGMFMAILTASLALYGSSDKEKLAAIRSGISAFLTEKRFSLWFLACLVCAAAAVGASAWLEATREPAPPASGRTIHPAPPAEISFRGKKIDILKAVNPNRELGSRDPAAFAAHVANGRALYYRNCVFCHGDDMRGDGLFAHGFDPQPANFADPGTIAMLQESYLFWRIAKGGPGLPEESAPWSSAMPAWEPTMQENDIWDVILFLYEFTGRKPRAVEHTE
jgi:mono/diheme cytochrome c family protein